MLTLRRLAYSVLFPVTGTLELSPELERFLARGGRSLLFGESAEEYASCTISPARIADETAEKWRMVTAKARELAGPLLIALDADVSAVHRLHGLTAPLPSASAAAEMDEEAFQRAICAMAKDARSLGVTLLLSPTADVVTGENPWLSGRTLGDETATVSRLVASYVRGAKQAGIGTTLKHFPGNPEVSGQPATQEARVPLTMAQLKPYLAPFKAGVDAGADAVFMSPSIYDALDPPEAGSISRDLIGLLRDEMGFTGLVITCDLDHKATMRDKTLDQTVVQALKAGADLLLLSPSAVPSLDRLAAAIEEAVQAGDLSEERLRAASAAIEWTIHAVA
ncbi:MAG: glycoside hydrolase [Shinella sp.]|nr:MAG: glycoside hydrolase [Shinella sp.]